MFQSPPGLPEAGSIVWSGRTGRHRHTQCLTGLLLILSLAPHVHSHTLLNCQRVRKDIKNQKKEILDFVFWLGGVVRCLGFLQPSGARLYCLGLEDWRAPRHSLSCCALSEVCLLFYWTWSCGRVFRSPPASQPQTINRATPSSFK